MRLPCGAADASGAAAVRARKERRETGARGIIASHDITARAFFKANALSDDFSAGNSAYCFPNPTPLMQITLMAVRSNFNRTVLSFCGLNGLPAV